MAETNSPVTALPRGLGKVRMSDPGYTPSKDGDIPDREQKYFNQSIKALRSVEPTKAIRALARVNGTVSTAVFSYVQVALTSYRIMAYSTATNQFDLNGTQVARSLLAQMDSVYDYTRGYADRTPVMELLETMLKETVLTGGVSGELVINKFQLPEKIALVPLEQLRWRSRVDGTKYPYQVGTTGNIPLDIPNFWVHFSHQSANTFFSRSMMEAALNQTFIYMEFVEDMARVVRRAGHSRVIVLLSRDKVFNAAPVSIRSDPKKMEAYYESERSLVQSAISGLNPEDAIVTYDTVEFSTLSTAGEKADYTTLLEAMSGLMATSLKSMPSVLGLRLAGSQSLSNTESLIYLIMADAIRRPAEQFMSRALTLAARLQGADVYVRFEFDPIDLRPEGELEAFKSQRQSRILEQLSLGFLTDDEAAELLGTGPRAPGAPPLSGTFFHKNQPSPVVSPNSGPQEKAMAAKTPTQAGGKDNGR